LHRFKDINQFLTMAPSHPGVRDIEAVLGEMFNEAVTEIMAIDPGKASQNWYSKGPRVESVRTVQ
jgi:hypothetical protein